MMLLEHNMTDKIQRGQIPQFGRLFTFCINLQTEFRCPKFWTRFYEGARGRQSRASGLTGVIRWKRMDLERRGERGDQWEVKLSGPRPSHHELMSSKQI